MGLIRRNENEGLYSPYIENYNNLNNNQINEHLFPSSDEYDSDSQSIENQATVVPRRRGLRHRISVSQENLSSSRKKGVRRARRIDNLRYLMSLEEKDEDSIDAAATSTHEPSSSLFEELLTNPEKLEMWNSFVESSEEEQMRILNYRGLHDIKEEDEDETMFLDNSAEKTAEESWVIILDKRSDHPAYSPKECYGRVDRNLRTLLKRRHLPMGMLANLEREVVTFFCECPSSVFVCEISSSYERMLLHALCQYLNLLSKSYDDGDTRKTQVENRMQNFRPPSLLLSEYLQQNQHTL